MNEEVNNSGPSQGPHSPRDLKADTVEGAAMGMAAYGVRGRYITNDAQLVEEALYFPWTAIVDLENATVMYADAYSGFLTPQEIMEFVNQANE